MKRMVFRLLCCALVSLSCLAQNSPQRNSYGPSTQGATFAIPNTAGSQAVSFEYLFNNTPAAVSITIQGCMRGSSPNPGNVGTCDAATDTYTGTSNSIRSPSFTKVYDTFLITIGTLSAGTNLTVNTTVVVSKAGTSSGGGSGTVGPGTTNVVAKFTAATTIGNSSITDNGTTVATGELIDNSSATTGPTCASPSNGLKLPGSGVGIMSFGSNGVDLCANSVRVLQAVGSTGDIALEATTGSLFFSGGKGQHIKTQAATSDVAGVLTCAASTASLTFTTAYTSTPVIVVSDETTAGGVRVSAKSNTAFTVTCTGATDVVDYITVGNPN